MTIRIKDGIAEHARPLIAALEEKIRKEFGCEVKIGCEKELFISGVDEGIEPEMSRQTTRNVFGKKLDRLRKEVMGDAILSGFEGEGYFSKFEFQTAPTSPSRAVLRLDAQCQNAEQYFQRQGHEVSYVPYRAIDSATAGLHVNFSVWRDGENLCSRDCAASTTNPFRRHLGTLVDSAGGGGGD